MRSNYKPDSDKFNEVRLEMADTPPYYPVDAQRQQGFIYFGLYTFTAEIGEVLLKNNNKNNRKLSDVQIKRIASQMKLREWEVAEAICFDWNNNLINGQHRLSGLVRSRKDCQFLIIWGYKPQAALVMDQGKLRTTADLAQIQGLSHVKDLHARTLNAMFLSRGTETSKAPNKKRVELYLKYQDSIDFVYNNMPKKSPLAIGKFTSAIAKAYYYEDLERLKEFMRLSNEVIVSNELDKAPVMLANAYLRASKKDKRGVGVEWYFMAEKAVFGFCTGDSVSYGDRVYYPLPDFDDETNAYNQARFLERVR